MATDHLAREPEDLTVYPEEEVVGESLLHSEIVPLLCELVSRWIAERGMPAFAASNQFIYFRQHDTRHKVAPDVYVMPGARPDRLVRSWKTWIDHAVPRLAIEVVSIDIDKDYIDGPRRYDELGVEELIVFDPTFADEAARVRFQVFRRQAGRLVRIAATDADRVESAVLGCHLVSVGDGASTRLRLGTGADGSAIFPTEAEHQRSERLRLEAELARLGGR